MNKTWTVLIAVILLGVAALFFMRTESRGSGDFDRSGLGSKGLAQWLPAQGIPVLRSNPRVALPAPAAVSLRILPLFDPDENSSVQTETGERLDKATLLKKISDMPTLIVLPKWQSRVAAQGVAKPDLLVSTHAIEDVLSMLTLDELNVLRSDAGFTGAVRAQPIFAANRVSAVNAASTALSLHYAQVFNRNTVLANCAEVAGIDTGALLLSCGKKAPVFILSDPDLLNNHGLAQADNAAFAAMLIAYLRGIDPTRATQAIYLDTDNRVLPSRNDGKEAKPAQRESDFGRLFDYPLSAIWASLLLVTAICFWRGACRTGPLVGNAGNTSNAGERIEISKTAAVQAVARLLRLSGNDGRLVSQFVQNRLADAALRVFGPGMDSRAGVDRLFERLARRDPDSAQALRRVTQMLIEQGPGMRQAELHQHLQTFRDLSERINLETR